MEKKYNYIYIITNLINQKQYVGEHCCDDLDKDRYYGSGLIITESIKKYKKSNFKKEIIAFFPTKQEAFDAQETYIIKYNTLVPNGYNISPKGGSQCSGGASEETKMKIGLASKNRSEESNYRCGSTNRGKDSWMKGKSHSDEANDKNRLKHLGKKDSIETINKKRIASIGSNNPMFGKTIYDVWLNKYGKEEADRRYKEHAEKSTINSKGNKNGMYGKTFYQVWVEKYGKEEADIKYSTWKNNLKNRKRS